MMSSFVSPRFHSYLFRVGLLTLISLAASSTQAELIPADRLPPGGKFVAGVPGGIPFINDMFCDVTVDIPGSGLLAIPNDGIDDSPAIQAALDLCPNGQFVFLPAGTYKIDTTLLMERDGVVLRGAGMGATILEIEGDPTGIRVDGGVSFRGKKANVTGGHTRGSTTLTFASASDISTVEVGDVLMVYDLATTTDFVTVGGRLERRSYRNSSHQWTDSPANSGEYYVELSGGGAPSFPFALDQIILRDGGDEVLLTEVSGFPLAAGQWTFGNNDTLGFDTIYVRLPGDVDPDTLVEDGVMSYRNIRFAGLNHDDGYANHGQGFKVAGVSGNEVTLDRPFYWTWDNSAGSLEIRHYNQFGIGIGVEDLSLIIYPDIPKGDAAEAALSARTGLIFEDVIESWIKGVEVTLPTQNFILAKRTMDCTFHGNYVHTGRDRQGGSSYGIRMQDTNFNNLIENNRAYELRHAFVSDGMNAGHVFAYNFSLDPNDDSDFLYQDYLTHGSHPMYILWEGNIGGRGYADFVHGSASHMVYYRNYFRLAQDARRGTSLGPAGTLPYPDFKGAEAINFDRWNNFMSVIGNVLGYPAWTDVDGNMYPKFADVTSVGGASYEGHATTIYRIGYDAASADTVVDDATPLATLYRRDNYDYFNESVFDAMDTSELIDSMYLDSKPYWFGELTYPAFDPDSPGTATGTSNPAGFLFENGVRPNTIPLILDQPDGGTELAGATAVFSVVTDGVPAPTYQWRKDGVDLVDGGDISGATTAELSIANLEDADDGDYTVVATNSVGSVTSSAATLQVNPPAVITTQPISQEVTQGANVAFTIAAEGATPITYQWRKDGVDIPGATTNFLALNAVTPADAADYTVVATNAFGSDTSNVATLVVNVPPSFSANPSNQTITSGDNASFSATAEGSPAPTLQWRKDGVDISGETGSTLTLTGAMSTSAGSYTVVATNVAGSATSTAGVLTVNKDGQAITFGSLTERQFGDAPFNLTGAASSGLSVGYASSDTSVATVSGTTVTLVGAGTTDITASQGGNSEFLAADDVVQPLVVGKDDQTITFPAPAGFAFNDPNFLLTATASSGLPVSYTSSDTSVATVNDAIVTIVGVGSTTFTATQTGNDDFNAAAPVGQPLTVVKDDQTITFPAPASPTFGDSPFGLTATSSSGLSVSYTSSDPTVATVSGATVTVVGGGSTTLTAMQTGDGSYNAAPAVEQTLTVNKATQSITFPALADKTTSSPDFNLLAIASSGLPVSFTSSDPAVATVSGNVVSIVGAGTTTITASQSGGDDYLPADNSAQSLTVLLSEKLDQEITFAALPEKSLGDAPFSLTATASSQLPVSFTSSNLGVATVSGDTVTIMGPGTTLITASQPGDDTFLAANNVVQTLTVNSAPFFITQPQSAARGVGESASFSVSVNGHPTPALQWRFNGSDIAGANAATLNLSDLGTGESGLYDVVATNSIGSATSEAATLVVVAENYEGSYFGTLSDGSEWAMEIRPDQTGVFIAYIVGRESALVVDIEIAEDGTFSVQGSEFTASGASTRDGLYPPVARAQALITLTGLIDGDALSASIPELGLSVTGAEVPSTGNEQNDGLYEAEANDPADGGSIVIIAPTGQVLAVTISETLIDGASGNATSPNDISLPTFNGGTFGMEIAPEGTTVVSYATSPETDPIEYFGVADDVESITRLSNLSVRSAAGSGEGVLIAGFVMQGTGDKALLIRAVGPTLADFGVTDALADPELSLYQGSNLLTTNDDWADGGSESVIAALAQELGAFPLPAGSKDASLNTDLLQGAYTSHVRPVAGTNSGVALLEVYDAEADSPATLSNLSIRTTVDDQAGGLIMGFVVDGNTPISLLIRAAGPSLADFGITGFLPDPRLSVVDGEQSEVDANDDWGGTTELMNAFAAVGAFDFGSGDSKDAALLINLEPGVYTVLVSGASGGSGVALAEIYVVP